MINLPAIQALTIALFLACTSSAHADVPLSVGAIGDSLTAGFNATSFGDNRDASWATGSNPSVYSVAMRLAQSTGRHVVTANEAITGSVVKNLDRQITRILSHQPDVVTITIGANDICMWPDDYESQLATFRDDITAAITRLTDARPDATIALAAIPDLYRMWTLGSTRRTCRARWDLFDICQPLLGAERTDEERARFVMRWQLANATLAGVAADFPDHVIHNPELATTPFRNEHITAKDCFHPTVSGQALFADVAWELLFNQ